jgi:sec-independent protein translocase protein TatB
MFDIGWSEMFIIAVLAIVVIGPKQLPQALRAVGYWVGKVRGMARDFQNQIDDVVRESELDEIKQNVESITDININDTYSSNFDPSGTTDDAFAASNGEDQVADIDDESLTAGISFDPPEFNPITDAVDDSVDADTVTASAAVSQETETEVAEAQIVNPAKPVSEGA